MMGCWVTVGCTTSSVIQRVLAILGQKVDLSPKTQCQQTGDSDAPDAKGRFKKLGVKALAAWLIRTRGGDMRKITGSLNQQIVFNRNDDPSYAKKMESVREEVKRQLGKNKKK